MSGDFSVGAGRVVKEEQSDQSIAPGRKRGDRVAQHLLPLQLGEHLFGKFSARPLGLLLKFRRVIEGIEALFFGAQAFVIRILHEPLGERLRLAQTMQIGKQVEADCLENVGSIFARQPELDGNGENQVLVFLDQSGPGRLIALTAFADQALA